MPEPPAKRAKKIEPPKTQKSTKSPDVFTALNILPRHIEQIHPKAWLKVFRGRGKQPSRKK